MTDNPSTPQVPDADPGQDPSGTPVVEYITPKHLEDKLVEFGSGLKDEVKKILSKGFSGAQSHTDRVGQNIRDEFNSKLVTALNKAGIEVTPEAIAEANRQVVLDDIISERIADPQGASDPAGPGEPSSGDEPSSSEDQYVEKLGDQLCKKLGVEFSESDPEWAAISAAAEKGDPLEYLDAIREQAAKKKAREASAREGRIHVAPADGGPSNPLDGLTNQQLWDEAMKEG